jgi:hypothetical protein
VLEKGKLEAKEVVQMNKSRRPDARRRDSLWVVQVVLLDFGALRDDSRAGGINQPGAKAAASDSFQIGKS